MTARPAFPFSPAPGWGQRGTATVTIATSLAFDAIEHAYGAVEAVRGVTLAVEPGEIVCLLGPSGCGKSTLLRLAAGLERPTGGRVLIDGREVSGAARMVPPEKRGVGLVFQDFALFPHLTILQNVMYGLSAMPKREAERAALTALARVGLADYGNDYPHTLSGGEQQRVALARAITPRPGILLMDEPFSGLDARLRDNVRDETLAVIRETRATCIVVTHDPEEAMRMADRIALMRAGRLIQLAPPEALYRMPVDLQTARFFSEINEVPGTVNAGIADCALGRFPAPGLADGEAVVCIRPRGIRLAREGEGVDGRLLTRRFLGEVDLLEVGVDGLAQPIVVRAGGGEARRAGEDVKVSADVEHVLVFPTAESRETP